MSSLFDCMASLSLFLRERERERERDVDLPRGRARLPNRPHRILCSLIIRPRRSTCCSLLSLSLLSDDHTHKKCAPSGALRAANGKTLCSSRAIAARSNCDESRTKHARSLTTARPRRLPLLPNSQLGEHSLSMYVCTYIHRPSPRKRRSSLNYFLAF
jgi:hypothetical protein